MQCTFKQAVASATNCADAQTQAVSVLKGNVNISFYNCTVQTHMPVQPLIVAAGTMQASTQGEMDEVFCALTATATAATARKSLENIFSEGHFWDCKKIEEVGEGLVLSSHSRVEALQLLSLL